MTRHPATGAVERRAALLVNLGRARDSVNGNWSYGYDGFNRLASSSCSANSTANCPNGQSTEGYSYAYDQFGNRWQQHVTQGSGLESDATFGGNGAGNNNRVDGLGYDAAGNVTGDGAHTYAYDGEGRLVSVDGGSTATYVYDAAGRRIEKTTPAGTVYYLYDLAGHVITELNSSGGWNRGEVYAGGGHVATYVDGKTYFAHGDWLGTERVRTDGSGSMVETCQGLPFGDELNCAGGDVSPLHFAGKERDSESGLDDFGARYDASSLGRFMSPDPLGGHLADPQGLDKYVYVRDNPTTLVDPTGLYTCRDSIDCSSAADIKFENTLAGLRKSKDADVARGAAAYGRAKSDNGVTVDFADLSKKGENGSTVSTIGSDSQGHMRANSDVTINSKINGDSYAAAIGHEGSHAADAQDVVRSGLSGGLVDGQPIHAGMDITHYQSEVRAWGVTQSILASGNFTQAFDCGAVNCTLGANVAIGNEQKPLASQLGEVIDRILASQNIYNQGGRPMGPNNQGPNTVNGVTLTPKASVPH
jgi:RHS repeat-associated protein